MLETVDLAARLAADDYKGLKDDLRVRLNKAQMAAREAGLGVVVVIEGWDYAGKAAVTRFLAEPLDPRGLATHVVYPPTREERRYPFAHRYLTRIPARGRIGLFLRSWYYHAIDARVQGDIDEPGARLICQTINDFERSLADDGYLVVKFWLHIDRQEQKARRKELRGNKALRRQRIGPDDPKQHKHWRAYTRATEAALVATNTEFARWYPIPATDPRLAETLTARTLCECIEHALATPRQQAATEPAVVPSPAAAHLASIDLSARLPEKEYDRRLRAAQERLVELQYECAEQRRAVVFCLEGWDAAGKGGVIRRLTTLLDPRYYTVHAIGAPRGEEAEHHYLWRFWQRVPPAGQWAIFDRSWYGRVLVERVEGYARPHEWQRAYREINTFEDALLRRGTLLLKYFLHISEQEQLRRFQEREEVPYKQYKISSEDWRNRERRGDYLPAVEEMLQRTSSPLAPWLVVPNEDKHLGRITLLEDAVAKLRGGLQRPHR